MKKLLVAVVLFVAACTPAEVRQWYADLGVDLPEPEVVAISEWTEQRDCLPGYGSGPGVAADWLVECAIYDSAVRYGINPAGWARVAFCESSHNPDAGRRYLGLFQHAPEYFTQRAIDAGYPGVSITSARGNAFVAAWLWVTSGPHHWPVCRWRY